VAGTARVQGPRRVALGVDVDAALDLFGGVLKWVGPAFLAPAAVALFAGESAWPFLVGGAATTAAGAALDRLTDERQESRIGPREGFLVVALVWLLVPAFGALPFLLGDVHQLSDPVDAYFEAMSGFTATGATVLGHIDGVGEAMLFWRQLTHWLGGMGIIVLAVAVLPRLRVGGRRLLQSELAGPAEIEPLSTTIRQTARRLWGLYVGLSIVSTLVLLSAFPRSGVASSGPSSDRVLLKPAAAVVLDDEVACEVLEPSATFVPRTPAPSCGTCAGPRSTTAATFPAPSTSTTWRVPSSTRRPSSSCR